MTATHYSELGQLTEIISYYVLLKPGSIQPCFPKWKGVQVLNLVFYKYNTYSEKGKKINKWEIMHTVNIGEAPEASACVRNTGRRERELPEILSVTP